MPFNKARQRAKEIEQQILKKNGASQREFTNKEVYLLLLDEMNKKLDKHIQWCQETCEKYIPEFNKQATLLSEVCKGIPTKGFCENVDRMYHEFYPEKEDSIPDRVKILWYDRKILRWVLGASVGALITSLATLAIGFMKGVF